MKVIIDCGEFELDASKIVSWCDLDATLVRMKNGTEHVVWESYISFSERLGGVRFGNMQVGQYGVVKYGPETWRGEKIIKTCDGLVFLDSGCTIPGNHPSCKEIWVTVKKRLELG